MTLTVLSSGGPHRLRLHRDGSLEPAATHRHGKLRAPAPLQVCPLLRTLGLEFMSAQWQPFDMSKTSSIS